MRAKCVEIKKEMMMQIEMVERAQPDEAREDVIATGRPIQKQFEPTSNQTPKRCTINK
jgi:hypothetical protein